ncbi:hypothetical protein BC826DRAFT_432022 [Russula brevipes]|nr:hypothetical protein BC826DRAFT_432022 [Russula brevipes]
MGEHLTHFHEEFGGPRDLCMSSVRTSAMAADCCDVGWATVNELPDDALLEIFDSYLNDDDQDRFENVDEWHTLVHVCRRWRNVVFASPRRLKLRLLCTNDRPVRAMLDIWPALPIAIENCWIRTLEPWLGNLCAALEHPDRVCSIDFYRLPRSAVLVGVLAAAMRAPFPELTYLRLWSDYFSTPVIPGSFLGGSAPRLRTLKLRGMSFPALPNLLLSAGDLVDLTLLCLPDSGYISPEAMVACLSSMSRLQTLSFGFPSQSPQSRDDQPSPPPQTRAVFPALTDLAFKGMTDYLDDFLARIDTPVLNKFSTTLSTDAIFDVPQLTQFIGRAKGLEPYKIARVAFTISSVRLSLTEPLPLSLEMTCGTRGISRKVHAISLVCGRLSPFLSLVERLDLIGNRLPYRSRWEEDTASPRFLEVFQPFTAIQSLHVSEGLVPFIALALQQLVGERATEVLPKLCDLFMQGSEIPRTVQEAMQPFLTARRLSGQPVVRHWEASTIHR